MSAFDDLRHTDRPVAPDRRFAARLRAEVVAALSPTIELTERNTTMTELESTSDAAPPTHAGGLHPYISVVDAAAAIDWYVEVFAAVETVRYVGDDGRIGHAELEVGAGRLLLSDEYPDYGARSPVSVGGTPVKLYAEVPDVDATWARAVGAGAVGERPPADQAYGRRSCAFADPFGHQWMVQTVTGDPSTDEIEAAMDGFTVLGAATEPAPDDAARPVKPIDLASTYLHLGTGPEVTPLDVDETFWQTIDQRTELHTGRLVLADDTTEDWDGWEMHPAGDELIVVTSGAVMVHVEHPDRPDLDTPIRVDAPNMVLMPAGTWHTVDVIEPARILTVTWGDGTRHRPR